MSQGLHIIGHPQLPNELVSRRRCAAISTGQQKHHIGNTGHNLGEALDEIKVALLKLATTDSKEYRAILSQS